MNITLLTIASEEFWPVLELSAPNKLEYCLRHKIQLTMRKHIRPIKDSCSVVSEREEYALSALKECDWLLFMGADTLIMNQTIDVRSFIDEDYEFIIGTDIVMINNDVLLLKNCENGEEFLKSVLYYNTFEKNDQVSMVSHLAKYPWPKTKIVHNRQFNSYVSDRHTKDPECMYQKGDFVCHFTGMGNEERIPLMKEYINEIIR